MDVVEDDTSTICFDAFFMIWMVLQLFCTGLRISHPMVLWRNLLMVIGALYVVKIQTSELQLSSTKKVECTSMVLDMSYTPPATAPITVIVLTTFGRMNLSCCFFQFYPKL